MINEINIEKIDDGMIYLIGKTNKKEKYNGPSGVFYSLKKQFYKYNDISVIEVESIRDIFLIKNSKNIVCVCSDGLSTSFILWIKSLFDYSNTYYLIANGIFYIDSKYIQDASKRTLFIERILYKFFKNLIVVSNLQKQKIRDIYKRKKNVYVIHNGFDTVHLKINIPEFDTPIKIVMTGGVRKEKGIFNCLNVVFELKKYRNVVFDVFGGIDNDETLSEFKSMVDFYGLSECVSYHGYVESREALLKKYQEYHFSLALSEFDTFNISVLEAMNMGCIPIISNNCGVKEVVLEKNLIVDSSDTSVVVKTIIEILNDRELYIKIRDNNYRNIQNLNWEKVSKKYYHLLKEGELE